MPLSILFCLLPFIINSLDLFIFTINGSLIIHEFKFILKYLNTVYIVI